MDAGGQTQSSEHSGDSLRERLLSPDPVISDRAWIDLWRDLLPRIEKKIQYRLACAPEFVRQRLDEIANDVTWTVCTRLEQVKGSIERYALGVAERKCRQALESRRDKELTVIGSRDIGGAGVTASKIAMDTEARRNIRQALQNFRQEMQDLCKSKRCGATKSPLFALAAIDLCCAGHTKPADLRKALGIPPSSVTHLRSWAFESLHEHLVPALKSSNSEVPGDCIGVQEIGPGTSIANLWAEGNFGCFRYLECRSNMDPTHQADGELYRKAHENIVSCPVCSCTEGEEVDAARLDQWMKATRDSIAASSRGASGA